jgi:hypothetical protein
LGIPIKVNLEWNVVSKGEAWKGFYQDNRNYIKTCLFGLKREPNCMVRLDKEMIGQVYYNKVIGDKTRDPCTK